MSSIIKTNAWVLRWGLTKKLKREFDRIKSDVQDVKEDVKEMREADVPQMQGRLEFWSFEQNKQFFFGWLIDELAARCICIYIYIWGS